MNYYEEKIESDPIIPARIYIRKALGSNCHYPLHWHNNLEFDLVLEGMIKGKINSKKIEVPPGEFFFVNSGDLHETDADDKNKMCSITILMSYTLLKEYCEDIDSYYFDFSKNANAKNKVKDLILQCADLYEKKEVFYELEISIALRKICSILLNECKNRRDTVNFSKHEQRNMANIKKAIQYMEENYESYISLNDISTEIGMAPTYFSRFFKKTTGETFYSYLSEIRLYYAHKELLSKDISMTEVALNNGFSNVKSFIELFKKVYKTTPAKYKKHLEH